MHVKEKKITQDYRYKLTAGHYLLQTANKRINGIQLKGYAKAGQSCLLSYISISALAKLIQHLNYAVYSIIT